MQNYDNLIGGKWVAEAEAMPNINPSNTNDILGNYVRGDAASVDAAVEAARAALPGWAGAVSYTPLTLPTTSPV